MVLLVSRGYQQILTEEWTVAISELHGWYRCHTRITAPSPPPSWSIQGSPALSSSSWNIQGSPALSYLLGVFKDHQHCLIFLEYSRITGTVLSSWNIRGSLALSYLLGSIQGSLVLSYLLGIFKDHRHCPIFLGVFKDHQHCPIFLEYSRITGTVLSSWNIQGS